MRPSTSIVVWPWQTGFFLLTATLWGLCGASAKAAAQSNVLWIYLEDVSGWFSCYGDSVIETPHIDALAAAGTRFDRFYTPAGVCSATRSAIVTGMMQTSIGAHNHRSCRAEFRGQSMGPYDKNVLADNVVPLPIRMRQSGYWTFNEGGKDDYNFEWSVDAFYDFERSGSRGWAPASFVAGDCLQTKRAGQLFFGQLQLGGGKLGGRTPKVIDRQSVPVPPYYPDVPIVREEIAHHYDCLLETDKQVGEIIAALKRDGLYENTLIFLFSDHGYKLHRHKQMLYEGGIHMPLIVAGPGIAAGKVRTDLISGIDVTAASLAACGAKVPATMEGRDFLAGDYHPREYVVAARDRCDFTIEKIRAVVTPRFKYLRNYLIDRPYMQPTYKDDWEVTKKFRKMMAGGEMNETQLLLFGDQRAAEEFYDLESDPDEIHNLVDDPRFAQEIKRHRAHLAEWITETGDRGQRAESDIGLRCALKRWGEKCVNPEYDRVRDTATVWFGTAGTGIYRATLNLETGALSQATQALDVQSPGFLAWHPEQSVLYAVCNLAEGPGVAALAVVGETLQTIGEQPIGDGGAAHVAVHPAGKFLVTAQYGGGSIAVFPIAAEGSIEPRSQLIEHEGGSRVVAGRQDSPHPHWVGFDATGQFAFVPDLGLDGVMIYKVTDGIRLVRHGFAAAPPGGGSRHMTMSIDGKHAFLLNELALSITTLDYDAAAGSLTARSTVPTLTEAQKAKETFNSASEIRVHPSGNFVYAANRGHDSISVFGAAPDGTLTWIENEPIRGGWPRNFNIDPTGKWLLAAGRDSNTVAVFAIDQHSGELTYARQMINVPSSICVLFSR